MITVILSLVSWTGMARVVRGRFLALRKEDVVMAARLAGSDEMRIVLRHMAPSFLSHIIASVTLSIPGMILSETSQSFLGLGLRPPLISWGVLLQEAQNVRSVALAPWLLLPGIAVVITVFAAGREAVECVLPAVAAGLCAVGRSPACFTAIECGPPVRRLHRARV